MSIPTIEEQLDIFGNLATWYGTVPSITVQEFADAMVELNKDDPGECITVGCTEAVSEPRVRCLTCSLQYINRLNSECHATPADLEDPCGYCGSSDDPNDICEDCWHVMHR